MKTLRQFIAETSKAELAHQYDELERRRGVANAPPTGSNDLEQLYGQEMRDALPDDLVYGKSHRPGIDFVKDPAHANHPLDKTVTGLGYKYASSHIVMGKPFHIYVYDSPQPTKVRNLALTTNRHDQPVKSHLRYMKRRPA